MNYKDDWIIFVIMIGVVLIALGSIGTIFATDNAEGVNALPNPPEFQYYYKTLGHKFNTPNPLICTMEPENEDVKERFWDEEWFKHTTNGINEWKIKLIETAPQGDWNWSYRLYLVEDHANKHTSAFKECDVFIVFEGYTRNGILGQAASHFENSFHGYTFITIWTVVDVKTNTTIVIGETPSESKVIPAQKSTMLIPTEIITKIVQHEFGHALGLEHQYRTLNATNSTSIMNPHLDILMRPNYALEITDNDINAIQVLYGEDGITGWNNPVRERFIIIE